MKGTIAQSELRNAQSIPQHTKHMRPTTNEEQDPDKSDVSSSASVHSALRSSPSASGRARSSSMSSIDPSEMEEEEQESDSTVSSSSDEESSNDESGDEEIAKVTTQQKPNISAAGIGRSAGELQDRLRAFLPKFAEANEKLEREGGDKLGMEEVGDDEPHIEMNLGLGVLEEKREGESSGEESQDEEGDFGPVSEDVRKQEKDVMGKLMGGREKREGVIEEVG